MLTPKSAVIFYEGHSGFKTFPRLVQKILDFLKSGIPIFVHFFKLPVIDPYSFTFTWNSLVNVVVIWKISVIIWLKSQSGEWCLETAVSKCWGFFLDYLFQIKHKCLTKSGTEYWIVLTFPTGNLSSLSLYLLWQLLFSHSLLPFNWQTEIGVYVAVLCVGCGCGVGGRREHSNPSGSGELSELIVLYHLWTEVQNWSELSTLQSSGWWSMCPLEPDWKRWRDVESVQPATSKHEMNKPE